MHINHTAGANAGISALSGAQAAENAQALRRARELRDAATKLKASSGNFSRDFLTQLEDDPDASTVSARAGNDSASNPNHAPVSYWA